MQLCWGTGIYFLANSLKTATIAIHLILDLLNRKFGNLNPNTTEQIGQLSLEKLETLAESLLDFNTQADLDNWLTDNLSS